MTNLFHSAEQKRLFDTALAIMSNIGYRGNLVSKGYAYKDWFDPEQPIRKIDAALFGRQPIAYDTALIGIVRSNSAAGANLVNQHRALGAPLIIEVKDDALGVWSVGANESATRQDHEFEASSFANWINKNSDELAPAEFLRTKSLNTRKTAFYQPSLFAGLIPELEHHIGSVLSPLLVAAFSAGWKTYESIQGQPPPESKLFKVAFWLLTGKVFSDRGHPDFVWLKDNPDPDDVLQQVALHYGEETGRALNRETREAIFAHVWSQMDFRNLSVDVLSQIWSRTLVSPETRKRLSIHKTSSSIVRYIINQIPFEKFDESERIVLEPCAGSASFLIGALDRLRDFPSVPTGAVQRHAYFQKMLRGIECDPFGYEISRLCLSLADYPNPNGWRIAHGDVFAGDTLASQLSEARIVLCNPPFAKFSDEDKDRYKAKFWFPPSELLHRTIQGIHSDGVIGFVLPRAFLDGQDYRQVRGELVRRYRDIEITKLADKGWNGASPETVLLVATNPSSHDWAQITQSVVRERQWQEFHWFHAVGSSESIRKTADEAHESLVVPELLPVWEQLKLNCSELCAIAEAHKGIEWNIDIEGNQKLLVKDRAQSGYKLGVPPRVTFNSFETPQAKYLCFLEEYRRRGFDRDWDEPKVIMNKTARSRGAWRVAAFADFNELTCFETYFAIWPKDERLTIPLAAVLNSPIGNAFLTAHSGKIQFTIKNIHSIPFPDFTKKEISRICSLVADYQKAVAQLDPKPADQLLRQVDALVLDACGLSPKLQRLLLDYDLFQFDNRLVPFEFADYFPANFKPYFKLSEWLTGKPAKATVGAFRSKSRELPNHILAAFADDDESDEGDCQ